MKKSMLFLMLFISFLSCDSSDDQVSENPDSQNQNQTQIEKGKIEKTITVNGTTREYIVHIPESYSETEAHPLLFAFHGLGGNMESSYNNSKFHLLAESEGFIAVHPNGISNNWNAVTVANNIDIAFVDALITQLENDYNVDSDRIYSSGMSNGGYFSFVLACELSDKIAAIGSVTGLMFQTILNNCEPNRPIPVMQIHGTNDGIVNYDNVSTIISYWISHNNTNTTAIVTTIPDTDTTDGSTVERFLYDGGDNNVEVQHLKITGGNHDWPGYQGNMDINASEEVWNFVKRFDINGKIE